MIKGLVSVIIPTYKGADKIQKAVDCVIGQTYQYIEVIVVDDNGLGTDEQKKTAYAMLKYKDLSNVVYLVHDVNKNGAAARNTGIRHSKGEYLCFLDDDDIMLPEKTTLQIEKFSQLPDKFGMVFCAVDEVLNERVTWNHPSVFKGNFLYNYMIGKIMVCSSAVMVKREAVMAVNGWDETFKRHQDWEFFARIAYQNKVAYIEETCVKKYRIDANLPKDGHIVEEYRLKYLNKMETILNSF